MRRAGAGRGEEGGRERRGWKMRRKGRREGGRVGERERIEEDKEEVVETHSPG